MDHSDLIGGSSAERRMHCTGSAALEAQFPNEESPNAREGTALHAIISLALDTGELPPRAGPCEASWDEWNDEAQAMVVQHEILAVEVMEAKFWPVYEAVQDLITRHDIVEYDLELKRSLRRTCGPEVFGTMDFVGLSSRGYVVLCDFKFGLGVQVSPDENYQLAFYALGLLENDDPFLIGVDKLVFVIIQPPAFEDAPVCKEWETSRTWLDTWAYLLGVAYRRIKDGEVAYKAGKWCQFCRGKPACPTRNDALVQFNTQAAMNPLPGRLTPAKLAVLLDMGAQAAAQYEAVLKLATQLAEQGVKFPGWKLIDSVGHRTFTDEKLAEDAAVRLLGTDAHEKKLRSPAQLEKVAKKRKVDFKPLERLIHRPVRGGRLVPDSNPAPEKLIDAGPVELPAEVIHLAGFKKK